MRRLWLIAQREIAAYASVPSFWVALLLGPVLMLLVGLAAAAPTGAKPAPAQTVVIASVDGGLRSAVVEALEAANQLGAPRLVILAPGRAATSDTVLALRSTSEASLDVVVQGRPIAPVTAALLQRDLRAALGQRALREAGVSVSALETAAAVRVQIAWPEATAPKTPQSVAPQVGRFAIVMLLWMNLVGALGMLLQAIVRERSNRTLDSLLAAARSTEIIFGKLLGVGVLSVLVLAAWLGSGAAVAVSPFGAAGQGIGELLLGAFRNPATLVQAGAVYVLAFTMYGSALIGLGAVARDLPAAQNLSRPVFGVLLLVFFVALTQLTGAAGPMSWLAWLPPFTPFVILMAPPGALPAVQVIAAFALMLATTVAVAAAAAMALTETPLRWRGKRRNVLAA